MINVFLNLLLIMSIYFLLNFSNISFSDENKFSDNPKAVEELLILLCEKDLSKEAKENYEFLINSECIKECRKSIVQVLEQKDSNNISDQDFGRKIVSISGKAHECLEAEAMKKLLQK